MEVFVLRADYGRYTDSFKKNEYVGIGWFEELNPIAEKWKLDDKEWLKQKYREKYAADANMRVNQNVGQIYRFINDLGVGDIIISPYNTTELLIGQIVGDLYYISDSTSPYPWRKKVKWLSDKVNRQNFSQPLQNTLKATLTCFKVKQKEEIFAALGLDIETKKIKEVVPFDSKYIYEQIREKFLELDATEFEQLVSYVLRTLGFEPTQEIGKVGDGGIDFEGVLDVQGIASINLQVQVKRYDNSTINELEIRNFRGALKRDFQGCFITLSQFAKKAKVSAANSSMKEIQLIDGIQFTELFIEQYDKIVDVMENEENRDLLDKLRFQKSLLPL